MNTTNLTIMARAENVLAAVRALPICQLSLRPNMLVDIMQQIVTHYVTVYDKPESFIQSWSGFKGLTVTASDAGFKFLGAGYFSAAFSNEALPGQVIKVGFKKEDSGAAYAAFCRQNQHLQGIPKIHAIARHNDCYTVVMDHLEEFKVHKASGDLLNDYNMACALIRHDAKEGDASGVTEWDKHVRTESRGLMETCNAIREFFTGIASFDIHQGNVMLDKQGNMVITDPVSYTNDSLSAVEFGALCDEIAAIRLERQKEVWKARHERKHPDREGWLFKHNKKVAKNRRKQKKAHAKRQARLQAALDVLMADPELEGGCLSWPTTAPMGWRKADNQIRRIKAEFAPKAPKRGPVEVNAADLVDIEKLAMELVAIDGSCAGIRQFGAMLKSDRMLGIKRRVSPNLIHAADLREQWKAMQCGMLWGAPRGNMLQLWHDEFEIKPARKGPREPGQETLAHPKAVFPFWRKEHGDKRANHRII